MSESTFPLWSDEPAVTDLLSFRAVAATVADALFDPALDPIAIGLSGAWGSGKTSVLELVGAEIKKRSEEADDYVLVIPTQPWRYDPAIGPKESLIADVLGALRNEFSETDPVGKAGLEALGKLVRKVNWSKAVKLATKTALLAQIPSLDDVFGLINDDPESLEGEKGMAGFREDFEKFLAEPGLAHVTRVVVLVDDLDRCLPDTVVETLEAIRLFLSARGMSFVIAADEDRVADAIQQKLKTPLAANDDDEDPARLYLHKIVQTTVPLPGLSWFDTQAYLFLLLIASEVGEEQFSSLVAACDVLRESAGSMDDLELPEQPDLTEHVATAARLTPILYEKFHGNPRRIKRFLNDLNVRQSIAGRRGITLDSAAIAKLMVLERLLRDDFKMVLDWLATNQLRDRLEALDAVANQAAPAPEESEISQPAAPPATKATAKKTAASDKVSPTETAKEESFSDTLIRWAKLPPTLDASTISGYLYLAASFAKIEIVDSGLPERLRDLAAALSSSLKIDRAAIADDALRGLPGTDAQLLVTHLGRRTRDQPSLQKFTVESMLRIAELQPATTAAVISGLRGLPVQAVEPATAMKFRALDPSRYRPVLEAWRDGQPSQQLARTIDIVLEAWGQSHGN